MALDVLYDVLCIYSVNINGLCTGKCVNHFNQNVVNIQQIYRVSLFVDEITL